MKSHIRSIVLLSGLLIACFPVVSSAQLNRGGIPVSFALSMAPGNQNNIVVAPPSADLLRQVNEEADVPYQFAINLPVDLGIGSSGQWNKAADGTNVWRLNLRSPGALALTLYFDRFNLPEGGRLFTYSPQRTQLLGAFTSLNNNKYSTFATALIYGDQVTLEYDSPDGLAMPELHVSEVAYAYRGVPDYSSAKTGFGGAGKCEVNVKCSEGIEWQNQKRSVARLQIKRTGHADVWCTGSLVNNTKNDGKPYLITADHCGKYSSELDISQWIFYFNYESPGCSNPSNEPFSKPMTGATLLAHGGDGGNTGSDFFLVLLNSAIPDSFDVFYNGWNRDTTTVSPSGFGIHHPQGDIKKISTYTEPLQPAHWSNGIIFSHWRVYWAGTANGHGTTEGGSSGSPLFDNLGRLVGTLTGGDSSCDSTALNRPDYYGMFSYHWDKNGTDSLSTLKYWLDPINSGDISLNGWGLSVNETLQSDWISIFPNPVTDWLNLVSAATGKKLHLVMTDMYGKTFIDKELNTVQGQEYQVSLAGFASGMYLLQVSDGVRHVVRKIIKE